KDPVPEMSCAALTRDRGEGINRDRQAGEHEYPKHCGRPRRTGHEGRLLQEIDGVGDRIVLHWRPLRLLRVQPGVRPRQLDGHIREENVRWLAVVRSAVLQ